MARPTKKEISREEKNDRFRQDHGLSALKLPLCNRDFIIVDGDKSDDDKFSEATDAQHCNN